MIRKIVLFALLIVNSVAAYSQEHLISIFGGYTSATIKDRDAGATGWRITGLYEFNKAKGNMIHGLGIGYSNVKGSVTYQEQLITGPFIEKTTDYTITSVPIYYAPKYLFNVSEDFKPFVNLMVGFHLSHFTTVTDGNEGKNHSSGFYGGAGAGFMFAFKEKWFINASYEFSYLSNSSYYKNGYLTSVNLGVGIRF